MQNSQNPQHPQHPQHPQPAGGAAVLSQGMAPKIPPLPPDATSNASTTVTPNVARPKLFDHVPGEDALLAGIAGYVDTLGFVALFGLFTAHVTGNFIMIGSGLAGAGNGLLIKWLAFPAFIAGIVVARFLDNRLRPRGAPVQARALYALQAVLLAGFLTAGVLAAPIVNADALMTIVCGLLGAMAMGVQNAHARLATRSVIAHTVMTGNVTQAVIDAYDLLFPSMGHDRHATRTRFYRTVPPVLCFGVGASAGAAAYLWVSFWALLLPLVLLCVLSVLSGKVVVAPK